VRHLTVVSRSDGGAVTLVASGELHLGSAEPLREAVAAALRDSVTRLRLDLAGVDYLDSTGIGTLINARRRADARLVDFEVVGAQGMVAVLLETTGLGDYLGLVG